jgi:hypothetical protein
MINGERGGYLAAAKDNGDRSSRIKRAPSPGGTVLLLQVDSISGIRVKCMADEITTMIAAQFGIIFSRLLQGCRRRMPHFCKFNSLHAELCRRSWVKMRI